MFKFDADEKIFKLTFLVLFLRKIIYPIIYYSKIPIFYWLANLESNGLTLFIQAMNPDKPNHQFNQSGSFEEVSFCV